VLSEVGNNLEILLTPAAGGTSTNLTNNPAVDWTPAWSPDGTRIAFASDREGPLDLYVMNADGSGVMRVGTGVGVAWHPTWSPDGTRLAFTCIVDPAPFPWWSAGANYDICAINADGSGFARLTSEPGWDADPDWSPDGARIVFATDRYGAELVVMDPDGSDVTRLSPGMPGTGPVWSSDGTRIAFDYILPIDWDAPWMPHNFVLVMSADGTIVSDLGWGYGPTWRPSPGGPNDRPIASFTFGCIGSTCTLDGSSSSDSDGTIASYAWQFGDGTQAWGATVTHTFTGGHDVRLTVMDDGGALATSSQNVNQLPVLSFTTNCTGLTCTFDGSASFDPDGYLSYFHWGFGDWTDRSGYARTATHTYAAPGVYTVSLTAWDSESVTATHSHIVTVGNVNAPPVASFTSACSLLTCSFNASASSDTDGSIASYAWNFGDGTTDSGATASRTYAMGGAHSVTLTVTDNGGATSTYEQTVTVAPPRVGPRIAYDQCWADHGNWQVQCDTHVLVDGSETLLVTWQVGPKWSPDGSRIAFGGGEISVVNLADGSLTYLTNHPADDSRPAWTRDGRIAFVSDRDGSIELYVMEGDGSNPTRLTYNTGFTGAFRWSPDGGRIAFSSDRDGVRELYVMGADGSNPTRVTHTVGFNGQIAWSFDSGRIAFGCEVESGNSDICSINADGTDFVRLTSDPAADSGAVFSPVDGRIAFETARFGANTEIAVRAADGTVSRLAAGTSGVQPVWSPDGSQLVFVGTTPSWYSGKCCPPEGGACDADNFCMAMYDMNLINADGTGLTAIASGANADWFAPLPGRPEAAFTHGCSATTCTFNGLGSADYDGRIVSYAWQFGDGTSGSGPTPGHTYPRGDNYTATLTVTDNAGATGVVSMRVHANAPPSASFTVACVGPRCTFDASGSSDPDGTIQSYTFLLGDSSRQYLPTVTHTYDTGTFTVALYVVDNAGGIDIQQQTISVVNAPPIAAFTRTCNGLGCTFDGSGSSDPDGTIANYSWSFGDGTTSPWGGSMASHTYAAAGTYTVTLTVTGNNYGTGTQSQTVTVANPNAPPVASFTSVCGGLACNFNASGSSDPDGMIASYAWSFGDGTTGSGATASRTYTAGGTYTVTLTVTDNGGATGTSVKSVTAVGPEVHVGDLDRARTIQQNAWTATVTIKAHNGSHATVATAVVSGYWTGGSTGSCTTDSDGKCTVSRSGIPKTTSSVSFTVTNVARVTFVYKPASNHDPDGDSNGTTVTVIK
jgi:Tol biopolymer transport system component/chitodextrinase